jgi:RNase P protein component
MAIKIPKEQKRRYMAKLVTTDKDIRIMAKEAAKSAIETKRIADQIGLSKSDTIGALQRNLLKRWIRTKKTDAYGEDVK